MEKTSKTIRIDSHIIDQLIKKSKAENRSLSNVIETICRDHFSVITRKEFGVNGIKYMPIHMNNDEIYEVVDWGLSLFSIGNYCVVKAKKHHGGKGVAFCFDHYNINETDEKTLTRRHSFSIDPNWEILDYFDHWTHGRVLINDKKNKSYASEKINVSNKTAELIKVIKDSLVKQTKPKVNKIFVKDNWTKIYSNYESYHLV